MVLRVGYVREHFSSPLLQFAEKDEGSTFTLVECPSGTGQLISCLTNNEIDIAIALTDALIAGIAKGSTAYKLVGSFVSTPLNWAVIAGSESQYNAISDLRDTMMGISRYGSGSQIMAYVMALQQSWPTENLKFQVNNDIRGLINSVNDGSTSAFMWEWFTSKPFIDAGEARFIGSVPTPWPSWMIVAHPDRASATAVTAFLTNLSVFVNNFNSGDGRKSRNIPFIVEKWGYHKEDVEAWLETVNYPSNCAEISAKVVIDTLAVLEKAGIITSSGGGFDVQNFINKSVAHLT